MEERTKRCLPPGFQFDPTDEELISYFLYYKANNLGFENNKCLDIIPELDIYLADPLHHLNEKAFSGERDHWYFFSRLKPNRCTKNGVWKELGFREPIFTSSGSYIEIGTKIYLGFYVDGVQLNWIMEEYHLVHDSNGLSSSTFQVSENKKQDYSEWVLCRVHEANTFTQSHYGDYYVDNMIGNKGYGTELSYLDEVFLSVDDDEAEISFPN